MVVVPRAKTYTFYFTPRRLFAHLRTTVLRLRLETYGRRPFAVAGPMAWNSHPLIGLSKQLAEINNSSLTTTHSARNLGFIFDEHLTFSDQISSVSKSCYYRIRKLRCVRPYLDTKTAYTIATSIVHSKLDYCHSLYHNLPKSQIIRLQQIHNSLARAVVKALKSSHITPILRSLHWLKITERIEYKLFSLTYKVLTTTQPSYLHKLITVQPPRSTRSSSLVTLARPPTSSSLRLKNRYFQYAFSGLWNQLPASLRQPNALMSPIRTHPVL